MNMFQISFYSQTNQQFLKTVTEQDVELEKLRKQLRYKPGRLKK